MNLFLYLIIKWVTSSFPLLLWTWPWFLNAVHMQITQIFSNPYQFYLALRTTQRQRSENSTFHYVNSIYLYFMMKSYKSATLQPIAVLCADIKPIPVSANEAVTSKSHFSLALWHILTPTEGLGVAMSVRNIQKLFILLNFVRHTGFKMSQKDFLKSWESLKTQRFSLGCLSGLLVTCFKEAMVSVKPCIS